MQMHLHSFQWKWRSGYDPRLHAFPWKHLLTTLSITMRAPTVEPNEKIRAAHRHMEYTKFENDRIHRKSTTNNVPLAIWDTRWFECTSKTPLSLPRHTGNRCWDCRGFTFIHGYLKGLLNTITKTNHTLYTSHIVNNLGEELDFYFTTKQHCMHIRKAAHDILQSTWALQGSVAAGVSHLNLVQLNLA